MCKLKVILVKKKAPYHNKELSPEDEVREITINESDAKNCPKCGKPMLYCERFGEPYVTGYDWTYIECKECGYSSTSSWG